MSGTVKSQKDQEEEYARAIEAARIGEQVSLDAGNSRDDDPDDDSHEFEVISPSGASYPVLTAKEAAYYRQRSERYMDEFKFSNVSDLQDLDRVLSLELVLHRYNSWITIGQDYWGAVVSEKDYNSYIKDLSMELRQVKKSMGLDKATRDKVKGEQFSDYLANLQRRAKEFGVMREEQLTVGITLMHEIQAKITTYLNCDDVEREELGLNADQVLRWINDDVMPRFHDVDAYFRKNSQRFWIQDI